MLTQHAAIPQFGGKLDTAAYYDAVTSIIKVMRPMATLRTVADHLKLAGFVTPSGLTWNRERLANFLRSTAVTAPTKSKGTHDDQDHHQTSR
jgi:hypothetical protein